MTATALLLTLALAQAAPAAKAPEPPPAAKAAEPAPAPKAPEPAAAPVPLSFVSRRFDYAWDRLLNLGFEVDGLRINSVFFNQREIKGSLIKQATFGTRARVEVTNGAKADRVPGFAVAVFDADDHLLGVASGGTKLGVVKPGETETFDLNFTQVKERLPRGHHFVLAVELR